MNRKLLSLIVLSILPTSMSLGYGTSSNIPFTTEEYLKSTGQYELYMAAKASQSCGDEAIIIVKSCVDEIIERELTPGKQPINRPGLAHILMKNEHLYLHTLQQLIPNNDEGPYKTSMKIRNALLELHYKRVLELGMMRAFYFSTKLGRDYEESKFFHMLNDSISNSLSTIKKMRDEKDTINVLQYMEDMQSFFISYMNAFECTPGVDTSCNEEFLVGIENMKEDMIHSHLCNLMFLKAYCSGPLSEFKQRLAHEKATLGVPMPQKEMRIKFFEEEAPKKTLQSVLSLFPPRGLQGYFGYLDANMMITMKQYIPTDLSVYDEKRCDERLPTLCESFK